VTEKAVRHGFSNPLAGAVGFEPTMTAPKAVDLPLVDAPGLLHFTASPTLVGGLVRRMTAVLRFYLRER
jgi:hypothetical protein